MKCDRCGKDQDDHCTITTTPFNGGSDDREIEDVCMECFLDHRDERLQKGRDDG